MARESRNELMVLTDINFNQLNTSIEALGQANRLTDKEKEIGVNLLDEWEHNVVDKLENKRYEIQRVKSFLDGRNNGYQDSDEIDELLREKLAKLSGTEKLYAAVKESKETMGDFKLSEPVRPSTDPTKTIEQNDLMYAEYEAAVMKYNIERKKVEFKIKELYRKWFLAMRKSTPVKRMVAGMSDYLVKVSKYKTECKDKAHLAKINLSISDERIRAAIKEIINFTQTIR